MMKLQKCLDYSKTVLHICNMTELLHTATDSKSILSGRVHFRYRPRDVSFVISPTPALALGPVAAYPQKVQRFIGVVSYMTRVGGPFRPNRITPSGGSANEAEYVPRPTAPAAADGLTPWP
jgi:hypothetical protein